MTDANARYYILFRSYDQGMRLHNLLDENGVENRIAPAPRSIQGQLSCGMSLLIKPEFIDDARACIEKHQGEYHSIVPLSGQLCSGRDRYC